MKKVMIGLMMMAMGSAFAGGLSASDSALERQTKHDKHQRVERAKAWCKANPKECQTMAENVKMRHNAKRHQSSAAH